MLPLSVVLMGAVAVLLIFVEKNQMMTMLLLSVFFLLNFGLALKYNKYYLLIFIVFCAFNYYYAFGLSLQVRSEPFIQKVLKDMFAAFLYIVWAAEVMKKGRIGLFRTPANTSLVIYVSVAVLQLVRTSGANLLLGFAAFRNMVMYCPLFFVVQYYIRARKDLELLVRVLLLTGAAVALLGVYELFSTPMISMGFTESIGGVMIRRIYSTMYFPGILAFFMLVLTVLATCLYMSKCFVFKRRTMQLMIALFTVCMFLTYTRMALFLYIFFMIVLLWTYKRFRTLKAFIYTVLIIGSVAVIFFPSTVGRYVRIFDFVFGGNAEKSVYARAEGWSRPVEEYASDPLTFFTGIGIENMGNVSAAAKYLEGSDMSKLKMISVDNYFLMLLIGSGVFSLLLLIWFLASILIEAGRTVEMTRGDPYLNAVAIALKNIVLISVLYGLVGNLWELFPINAYFWMFSGLVLAVKNIASKKNGTADLSR